MRWLRRNKFRVGRSFFGCAVENGTLFVAGGRLDSRSQRCSADVRCVAAERLVRGCDSPCDALNADDDRPDGAKTGTPWHLVGHLPAPVCVFAHCVVTLPAVGTDTPPPSPRTAEPSRATSSVSVALAGRPRSTKLC